MYSLQFQSNEVQQRITVNGPQVGNWFAVVFVSWTDPNNDRIEQQGNHYTTALSLKIYSSNIKITRNIDLLPTIAYNDIGYSGLRNSNSFKVSLNEAFIS